MPTQAQHTGAMVDASAGLHHSGWRVTDQLTDQVIITQAGLAVTGVQVFFITGDGNTGSVFVANNHYTPKVVQEAIKAQAALVDTIGVLQSGAQ
jgi:hypothetical protein